MNNNIITILKKQFNDLKPSNLVVKNGKIKFEVFTSIFIAFISLILIVAVVYVLNAFTESYCVIKINRVLDIQAREYELLNCLSFIILLATFIYSAFEFEKKLFDSEDNVIFSYLPISTFEIFISKGIMLYIKEVIIILPTFLILAFTVFITNGTLTLYKVIFSITLPLLLPIIPMCCATFFCIPINKMKSFFKAHPIQASLIVIIIMAVACWVYTLIFDNIEQIIISGKITSLFSEDVMNTIILFTKYSYPTNLFLNFIYKKDLLVSFLILFAIFAVVCFASALFINQYLAKRFNNKLLRKKSKSIAPSKFYHLNPYMALFMRELHTTITSPNYSFICFSNIIVTPIMSFSLAKVLVDLTNKMIGFSNIGFEITLIVCLLFACATNSYCSTNISRDGHMALVMKTMPISNIALLSIKSIYCSSIMLLSNIITAIILVCYKIVGPLDAFIILVVTTFACTSQILLGTKLDLKHPKFARNSYEIDEGNDNVATVQVFGFIIIVVIVAMFLFHFLKLINYKYFNMIIAIAISSLFLGISCFIYFRHIDKNFDNLNDNYMEKGGN